ncbi:PDZ domain-containing protein [Austwickia sp. TVS 96-490-7B]|uniref:YlbL family protein n=1 Tax=Austwickia sp. TVS 96-490-7B TaxID=2830843 RepID=UPI001C570BE0|nr:PDZ domain-containing protein [Austwickia sp. TVS 96-490-7B]
MTTSDAPAPQPVDETASEEIVDERRALWWRRRRWMIPLTLLLSLAVAVSGLFVHPPYIVMRAGPVYDTLGQMKDRQSGKDRPIIEVHGAPTYPTEGALDFTTVALYGTPGRELNLWDYVWAVLQGADITPTDKVYRPNTTQEQVRQQGRAQMSGAQDEARVVALRAVGKNVPERVRVAAVAQGGPAEGALKVDDVITSIDGTAVTDTSAVRDAVTKAAEGHQLRLEVERNGRATPVTVGTVVQEGRRMMGVTLATTFTFPVEVTINAGDIGGPSAGLMLALGIYDKLTPGALTGGRKIAGTGTLAVDGTVGPIGGIPHKMVGARESTGAEWFLAPQGNCQQVIGRIPDGLHVVKVGTFDEARHAVEEIAAGRGDKLATCG